VSAAARLQPGATETVFNVEVRTTVGAAAADINLQVPADLSAATFTMMLLQGCSLADKDSI
jgi:hypothetical protein